MKHALALTAVLGCLYGVPASCAEVALEPCTYTENFEAHLLGAWASYPLWQDTAYDPNFRINAIVPGDANLSLEQRVTPYTNVDSYCGAQKLFDMALTPDSSIRLRYYLKSHLPFAYFKVRIAAGLDGKADVTFPHPELNRWVWFTVTWNDFIRENPHLAGKDRVKVNALAVLGKCPKADPTMPFYLGLDDITFQGARACAFRFAEPAMHKLPEFAPYIPKKPYFKGDRFILRGTWPLNAAKVEVAVTPYTDRSRTVYTAALKKEGEVWSLAPLTLSWPEGWYLATLRAYADDKIARALLSETPFTIHVAPRGIGGKHPRLWFDAAKKQEIEARLKSDRFKGVHDALLKDAESQRKRYRLDRMAYDLDQYPDENWLPSWSEAGAKVLNSGDAVLANALAWSLAGDQEAGAYAKAVLLRISDYPTWTHPWQIKRGRWADHRSGAWAHRLAVGYDLIYDLMSESERAKVRKALLDNLVKDAFKSHVHDNNITSNSSNWLAMIAGGSLLIQAAVFEDGPEAENLEPYFTGTAMKLFAFCERVANYGEAWGEGYGYNHYSFENLQRSLPALKTVFSIDFSNPLKSTWKEYLWSGVIKNKQYFHFGDSGNIGPASNWAWLVAKYQDPLLGWYYHFMKDRETLFDVLYETKEVPRQDPFSESPSKLFREVGTTVFKSGWEKDDMVFTMRSGPFYNHQHLDQGSFWFADRGVTFIEERRGSTYYEDPLYQPWYIQPVAHSTILINGNHQSQRVGDPLVFAEGFDDYAQVTHYLEGDFAAFATGDIGRLYWGVVKGLERNVLFIKPRMILMLDTVYPEAHAAEMTLLYQTARLADLAADGKCSTITREGLTLHIMHLAPAKVQVKAVATPHYLHTLQREPALEKEGMLTVTVKTDGTPLVAANLLTTTGGEPPEVTCVPGDGCMSGKAGGVDFAFSTKPRVVYSAGGLTTDAVAISWIGDKVFAARCTQLSRDGKTLLRAAAPITCEVSGNSVKVYHGAVGEVSFGAAAKPASVLVNGAAVKEFAWDAAKGLATVILPQGEGTVSLKASLAHHEVLLLDEVSGL